MMTNNKRFIRGDGGGGLTRPISRNEGADQLRGVPIIGQPPRDETRGLEQGSANTIPKKS